MNITASCPYCAAQFMFDDTQVGQIGNCPTCQCQVTLTIPTPASPPAPAANPKPPTPPTPPQSSALKPNVSARLLRRDYLNRVRAESSYKNARAVLTLICGLMAAAGVLAFVGAFLAPAVGSPGVTMAAGIMTGCSLIATAFAAYESLMVVFDIADVLIDQRK